jgi:feruloyl esterase
VFNDPKWDWHSFDFDRDAAKAKETDHGVTNATSPDLLSFARHGGKLLMYHGWADGAIPPRATVNYYASVVSTAGGRATVDLWMRLFMVPGMYHCRGGEGPNTFDMVGALDQWVEQGTAPDRMLASHASNGIVDRTRPLCPYPQVATYKGAGSIDEAVNFACKAQ